jgi:NAD(P)-dependent dehydrogenase (short-subunit alcohol dehydrogenase family)
VANAGQLGVLSPLPHVKPEDFEKVMTVNVTANYRLLRATDLLLRQSTAGRAVFVSSSSARTAKPFWGLYAASKAAVDAMAKSYASEVSQTEVKVNVFYPGAVRTAMRAKAMPGENPDTLAKPGDIAPKLIDMLSPALKENGKLFDMATGAFEDI